MAPEFETVIGLEVHCQLATETKLFCGCRAKLPKGRTVADEEPNLNTCPVCTGHPGSLPVLNKKAVELAIRAGIATSCEIRRRSVFARKNYFYPDLPKGYQISQYDQPLCKNGFLEVALVGAGLKKIRIERIHLEEDAGKSIHMPGYSLVNLNRASVPLIEIVSAPDLSSPGEAGVYLRMLYAIVTALEICDGNLQEGNFRCDANVSVRPKGSDKLGTRVEIKNINSFRFVERAIEYEALRQVELLRSGGQVIQETRTFDSDKGVTLSMRAKEEAHDYRYFPDPDLVPLTFDDAWIERIQNDLPELPRKRQDRYIVDFGLSELDASALVNSRVLTKLFEGVISAFKSALKARALDQKNISKSVVNLIISEVPRLVNETGIEVDQSKLNSTHIVELVMLQSAGVISHSSARQVLATVWGSGDRIETIVKRLGLEQVSDLSALEPIIDDVIARNAQQVAELRSGKDKVMSFLVGQVMKASQGKANPTMLSGLIKKKIGI